MLKIDDVWFVAEGEQNGRPAIIRGRQNLRHLVGLASHPQLLRIVWEYEVDHESGLPSPHLNARMGEFESLVFAELERDFLCIFFCVYLHDGLKEYIAYTSDVQATCDRFNTALAGRPPYPVQLSVEDDPDWNEYVNLMHDTGAWSAS